MKTCVVTGANRGIGLELCRQLAGRGDEVIGVCRTSSDELDAIAAQVVDGVDVADPDSVSELAAKLHERRIDLLINNAGVLRRENFGEDIRDAADSLVMQFRVNSVGPTLVSHALLPLMIPGSKIGIITSRMGSIADNSSGGAYGYRMSKAAVNIAGKSLAVNLKERGIAVALLHPGYVRTRMTGGKDGIDPSVSARGLIRRLDRLKMRTSGRFWHAGGKRLPW